MRSRARACLAHAIAALTKVELPTGTPIASSTGRVLITTVTSSPPPLVAQLSPSRPSPTQTLRHILIDTRHTMQATGRGSIARINYTGDEAAGEIKKLLDTVVSTPIALHPEPELN